MDNSILLMENSKEIDPNQLLTNQLLGGKGGLGLLLVDF